MTATGEQLGLSAICAALDMPVPTQLTLAGATHTWRGPFDVDALASASVAAASAAAASLWAARRGASPVPVHVQREHAALAFLAEGLTEPIGWRGAGTWDAIAGDYHTRTGWLRLHTNYPHHRRAALQALAIADRPDLDRNTIARAVASEAADDLERRVVEHGGAAAAQRSAAAWHTHPQGSAVNAEALLAWRPSPAAASTAPWANRHAHLPFAGIRVLDLTRVLAGPVATGFLAAWGADVLRIDPPGFEEVASIVPVTTAGKRTARLDLQSATDRARFAGLVAAADVLVHGYRSDALQRLGQHRDAWWQANPGLVIATLDAYGWTGPWAQRRGFDSLVQHSIGITLAGQLASAADRPQPLPCQALDHGTGWLLAAAAVTGLQRRLANGHGSEWRASLARTGALLTSLPADVDPHRPAPSAAHVDRFRSTADSHWGPLRRLRWPGAIGPRQPLLGPAVALGQHNPQWLDRPA